MPLIPTIGKRFGRLVVERRGENRAGSTAPRYWCLCDCGRRVLIISGNLRNKQKPTRSCGCLKSESRPSLTHGMCRSLTYGSWQQMINRCTNPKSNVFRHYAGRGITVCKRWLDSFEAFLEDMGEKPKGKRVSIERKDNSKGYTKENCKWSDQTEQMNNTRKNVHFTYQGRTQTAAQWGREVGVSGGNLVSRITHLGWSIEEAFSTPTGQRRPRR